jgi:hypothetical protein
LLLVQLRSDQIKFMRLHESYKINIDCISRANWTILPWRLWFYFSCTWPLLVLINTNPLFPPQPTNIRILCQQRTWAITYQYILLCSIAKTRSIKKKSFWLPVASGPWMIMLSQITNEMEHTYFSLAWKCS